jgi:hypothetical protein
VNLDDGIYYTISSEALYEMNEQFCQLSYLCEKCCISGVEPIGTSNGDWSCLAKEFTYNELMEKEIYIKFKVR